MGAGNSAPFDYDGQLLSDTKPQSTIVPSEQKDPESSPIYRSLICPDRLLDHMFEGDDPVFTVYDAISRSSKRFNSKEAIGRRLPGANGQAGAFVFKTYGQVFQEAVSFGAGLAGLGLKRGSHVGILSANRPEWTISSLGMYSQSIVAVTLYPTFGEQAIEYIVNQAELSVICCSKVHVKLLLKIKSRCPSLKTIIQYDPDQLWGNHEDIIDHDLKVQADTVGISLIGYTALVELGQHSKISPNPPKPEELMVIMYTSGTTGDPKGVMLTHRNVIATCAGVLPHVGGVFPEDVHLSYLPLAHIFENAVQTLVFSVGGRIGFFQGDVKKLVEDLQELKPTLMFGVPRVFTRIYQRVMDSINSNGCLKKWYINRAYNYQCECVRQGLPLDPSYDQKVFSVIRGRVGLERCRIVLTGAAPCPPYLMEFLRVVVACKVLQGYAMTETAAGLSISSPDDRTVGHVGPPVPCGEVRLVSVAEMNYLVTDKFPRGEVQVRGPTVFKGYFSNEEATKEAIDESGWMRTGDIGRLNPNGTISIIDRKKNIFKLSQGEYIAAEKIENVYARCGLVAQVWVYGNSFKSFTVAVVVPNAEKIVSFAKEKGWWSSDAKVGSDDFLQGFSSLVTEHESDIRALVFTALEAEAKGQLNGFERVKDILIEFQLDSNLQGFTEANECLTPSFKLRRNNLLKKYRSKLRELYAKNGEPPAADEVWPGEK